MDKVSTLTQLINDYGADVVILAIFLLIFAIILRSFINSYQKHMQQMVSNNEAYSKNILQQNEVLINTLLSAKEEQKTYAEKDIVQIFVKLNKILRSECLTTLNRIGCDRISIYVFHNGAIASHGLPFFKMSCITESIKKGSGLVSKMMEHNGIPLGMFDGFIDYLWDNGIYIISTSEENNITQSTQADIPELIDRHVFSMAIPIYDSEYNMMGFILEEHSSPIKGDEEIKYIKEELFKLAEKTAPVLAFSEYNKIK